jgi:hypothetical protein
MVVLRHTAIERYAGYGQKVFGQEQKQPAQSGEAYFYASGSTHQSQQEIFDPELPLNLPAQGALQLQACAAACALG